MYSWDKSMRERKNPTSQSFSSSLLDEIYREIDGGGDESYKEIIKQNKEKNVKKLQSNGGLGGRTKGRSSVENEEMGSLKRACLLEKWMEKKVNEKALARGRVSLLPQFDQKLMQDNDPLFFSSSSCSSDSSFGGFSSSETESFGAVKTKTAPNPKSVRTKVRSAETFEYSFAHHKQQSEFYLFDDYRNNHRTDKTDGGLLKSKARAQKIYANLKKIKQPISPGGRLTSFINSIFTNGNPKKNRESHHNGGYGNDVNASKSTQTSTCSSASSFSRSCLSKTSPNSRQKRNNGIKRSVRFYPVSVIVDEDCRPCGHKCIYEEEVEQFKKPMPRQQTNSRQPELPLVDHKRNDDSRSYDNLKKNDFVATIHQDEDDDFEDDGASDSSSDLFELDHLASFKDDRFGEDLPVYETTHLGLNRAIANGLIH